MFYLVTNNCSITLLILQIVFHSRFQTSTPTLTLRALSIRVDAYEFAFGADSLDIEIVSFISDLYECAWIQVPYSRSPSNVGLGLIKLYSPRWLPINSTGERS